MKRTELVNYLDSYLKLAEIDDYGPQGLQVESANQEIERIALAVDTAPDVIEAAAAWRADMLLVHHGILWGTVEPIAGPLGRRVRLLLENEVNLYAAHLALDAHPDVGNNAVLARMLDMEISQWWCAPKGTPIGVLGPVRRAMTLSDLAGIVAQQLESEPRILAYGPGRVTNLAIVTGFGADRIEEARSLGADTFLTGETSHANYWSASDYRMNVLFAGHYATETVGVKALGRHLAERYQVEVAFLDFPTNM